MTVAETSQVASPLPSLDERSSHLRRLEAESIHILRETAESFENPVLLYSIGKDSSVMLHLARKAFFPDKPPFPLLHIDSTWEFREMIVFRDQYVRGELGLDVIVQISRFSDGIRRCVAISEVAGMEGQTVTMQDIFVFRQHGVDEQGVSQGIFTATGLRPGFYPRFESQGIHLPPEVLMPRRQAA